MNKAWIICYRFAYELGRLSLALRTNDCRALVLQCLLNDETGALSILRMTNASERGLRGERGHKVESARARLHDASRRLLSGHGTRTRNPTTHLLRDLLRLHGLLELSGKLEVRDGHIFENDVEISCALLQ